ncbi:alpha-ketoglutarate-dependent dioxygenase AlkB [Hahella ganghwensis]|uniref:alpha-ketoglutarate-dependent dioxygenase AlkB n=1 Tax=Hahella ganghwensis TaxID=286420 RepID=UPI00037C625C|nr:alpha-ketoglutarate-dependent dioxygenase AlkB [Hahella ganghwensis]
MTIDLEPKVRIIESFVSEPDRLFSQLRDMVPWDERMRARKTASYGVSYDYSGMTYPETGMLEELAEISEKISKTIGFLPNNCLLNYYPDGKSTMGYHSDSSEELLPGTGVVIVSLGAERHIWYRLKADQDITWRYLLKAGALLYMDNDIQKHWMHAIKKEENVGARISLTFRHIVK